MIRLAAEAGEDPENKKKQSNTVIVRFFDCRRVEEAIDVGVVVGQVLVGPVGLRR